MRARRRILAAMLLALAGLADPASATAIRVALPGLVGPWEVTRTAGSVGAVAAFDAGVAFSSLDSIRLEIDGTHTAGVGEILGRFEGISFFLASVRLQAAGSEIAADALFSRAFGTPDLSGLLDGSGTFEFFVSAPLTCHSIGCPVFEPPAVNLSRVELVFEGVLVPEPASALLVLAGLFALGCRARYAKVSTADG